MPSAWPPRSQAAARSAGSRTRSRAGLASSSDGTHCPRSASLGGLVHGSPRLATACCPPARSLKVSRSTPGSTRSRGTHRHRNRHLRSRRHAAHTHSPRVNPPGPARPRRTSRSILSTTVPRVVEISTAARHSAAASGPSAMIQEHVRSSADLKDSRFRPLGVGIGGEASRVGQATCGRLVYSCVVARSV